MGNDAPAVNTSPAAFTKVPKTSELVARRLLRDITSRQLEEGEKLPSEELMLREYGVGRASLREGLRLLEVNGLITIRPGPGGGPVVARVNGYHFGRMAALHLHMLGATFGELEEARRVIESALAAQSARQPRRVRTAAMRRALRDEETNLDDVERFGRSARGFHDAVTQLSGNKVLHLISEALTSMLTRRVSRSFNVEQIRDQIHEEHQHIAEAIVAGDEQSAQSLMDKHISSGEAIVRKALPGLANEVLDWE